MKKIICFLMVLVLVLTGCSKPAEGGGRVEKNENKGPDTESQSTSSAPQKFVPDLDAIQLQVENIFYINWISMSGISWEGFNGFENPNEIPSSGLMNLFIHHFSANADLIIDSTSKYYTFTENDVQSFLDTAFEEYSFDVSDTIYWTPSSNGTFRFYELPSPYYDDIGKPVITDTVYDETNETVTVTGYTCKYNDFSSPSGYAFTGVLCRKNNDYLWRSFSFYPEEITFSKEIFSLDCNDGSLLTFTLDIPSAWKAEKSGSHVSIYSNVDGRKVGGSFGAIGVTFGKDIKIPEDALRFGQILSSEKISIDGRDFLFEKCLAGKNGNLEAYTYYFVCDTNIIQIYFLKPINENWDNMLESILLSLTVLSVQ